MLEDKLRKEKQERLKDRVVNSKAIVDNSKALTDKQIRQQEEFKRNLQEKKETYQLDLARRLQRVYNKPLMLEASLGKVEKFSMNSNMRDKISEVVFNNNEDQSREINEDIEEEAIEEENEVQEENEHDYPNEEEEEYAD